MKFLTSFTLTHKIVLFTTLGVITAVIVFGFTAIKAVNQATEVMLSDRLTTAGLVADYLNETLERAITTLEDTANKIGGNGVSGNLEPKIEALEDTFRLLSIDIHSIYLVNEEGRVMWSKSGDPGITGSHLTQYPDISQAMEEGGSIISGLTLAPTSGTPVVMLISPVREAKNGGKSALVVAFDVARSSIGGFIQPIKLGNTGYVEIIDQNGIVVTRTQPGPELAPFEKSDHSERFATLIEAGKPTQGLCHTCHETVSQVERRDVLAFVPLSEARWGVVIRQGEEEALASVRELRQNLLLFGSILILVALSFVVFTTRNVISRIRMLTTASQRIAEGDLTTPIVTLQKDEIGTLAKTFEGMRSKLETSYAELEQRTRELSSLLTVSEILSSLPDSYSLDAALGDALDKTLDIMRCDIGGILLLDEERQKPSYQVYRGLSEEYTQGIYYNLSRSIEGMAVQTGKPILIEDVTKDDRISSLGFTNMGELRCFASVPLRLKGKILGVLSIGSREPCKFTDDDIRLTDGIARQIAIAIEKSRLHQEVQHKDKIRGELLREIFSIQESERKRIARELHDETTQVLASLNANLEAAANTLPAHDRKTEPMLRRAQELSISILDDIHRLIYELRPTLLDDLGLVAATRWLVDNSLRTVGVNVNFKIIGQERRISPEFEITIFRVIQEAASNIAKHSKAERVDLKLHFRKNSVRLHIKDDGIGFDVNEAISSKKRPRGLGLLGMRERVELMNGTLNIRSRLGSGTEIDIEIPDTEAHNE